MPVPLTVWQQLCECPGAGKERSWKEDRDEPWPGAKQSRGKRRREWQEREEARKEAFEAARATADGKTRDEVRDLYVAELRTRGLDVPLGPLLEATVDTLTGHPARALFETGKGIASFIKQAWDLIQPKHDA